MSEMLYKKNDDGTFESWGTLENAWSKGTPRPNGSYLLTVGDDGVKYSKIEDVAKHQLKLRAAYADAYNEIVSYLVGTHDQFLSVATKVDEIEKILITRAIINQASINTKQKEEQNDGR